jgi:transposase
MKTITTIGIDLAKNTFQLHGVNARGKVVLRKTLRRDSVALFFANLPACLVGMEACATSAYWARVIESCGHTVKRIHPRFVKPYLMADKNDANDAAAICEAVQRPHMRFVPHKTQDQADIQALHRVRKGFVQARTAAINQARGVLAEYGIVIKQGACHLRSALPTIIEEKQKELSGVIRGLLTTLYAHIKHLDEQIVAQNNALRAIAKQREDCQRLLRIPGVGVQTATLLLTVAGKPQDFKNGRQFSAYLGLVPRQHSTGGKQRMYGISKRGNSEVRTLLIHGARAVLRAMQLQRAPLNAKSENAWLIKLVERRGHNRACVALANKMARIAWSMLARGEDYRMAA